MSKNPNELSLIPPSGYAPPVSSSTSRSEHPERQSCAANKPRYPAALLTVVCCLFFSLANADNVQFLNSDYSVFDSVPDRPNAADVYSRTLMFRPRAGLVPYVIPQAPEPGPRYDIVTNQLPTRAPLRVGEQGWGWTTTQAIQAMIQVSGPDGELVTGMATPTLGVQGSLWVRALGDLDEELHYQVAALNSHADLDETFSYNDVEIEMDVYGGQFDGAILHLKGKVAYGTASRVSDNSMEAYGDLFILVDWGIDPFGNQEYLLFQMVYDADVQTSNPSVLPLSQVYTQDLGASPQDYVKAGVDDLLAQLGSGQLYLDGAVPELLYFYDFSGKSTVPVLSTLPLIAIAPPEPDGAVAFTNFDRFVNQYDAGIAFHLPFRFTGYGGNACGPTSLGMLLNTRNAHTDPVVVFDNTTTRGYVDLDANTENGFLWPRATDWLGGKTNAADHFTASSPLPPGTSVVYLFDLDDSAAIDADWNKVDRMLARKKPVVLRTDLGLGTARGGGHVILLLGKTHSDKLVELYGGKISGDCYIVADPAGHYFANPKYGCHYADIPTLRARGEAVNYGGWCAMYPAELLRTRDMEVHRDNQGNIISQKLRFSSIYLGDAPSAQVGVHSPVSLVVTDPTGNQSGFAPDNTLLRDIPSSWCVPAVADEEEDGETLYITNAPKTVFIDLPTPGTWRVDLVGTGSGPFELSWDQFAAGGAPVVQTNFSGSVNPGDHLTYYFVVSSTGGPTLKLVAQGGNLVFSWPTNAVGFQLESNSDLANASGWSPFSGTPAVAGDQYLLTVPILTDRRFFRLHQP